MAKDKQFDQSVSRWLEETAPARLPERVLNTTFERTRNSRQQVGWRAFLRRFQVTWFVPALGGAAVVVMAVALGLGMYANRPGIGGPPLSTASPAPAATGATTAPDMSPPDTSPPATQPPTASPTHDVYPGCIDLYAAGGTYRASAGRVPVTATVPAGWTGSRDAFSLGNAPCIFGGSVNLVVSPVSHVYTDACDWLGADVEVDTPAAATAAFAAQKGHQTTGPTDVTLAGYPASLFEFSVPADFDARSRCYEGNGNGSIALWRYPGSPGAGEGIGPGEIMSLYVVNVDGSTIAVAATSSSEDATTADVAEVDAIVASLRFEPAAEGTPGPIATAEPDATASPDGQPAAFAGNWEATDAPPDSSHLTMEIIDRPNGTYRVTILDDHAGVCDGVSSTMTGVAEEQEPGTIVIARPEYLCDDGSQAHAVSGPIPLDELLRNLGFSYDPASDSVQDSLGLVWSQIEL